MSEPQSNRTMSRREFLETLAALSATGLAAAACAPVAPPAAVAPTPVPPTATPVPPTATPVPAGPKLGGTLKFANVGAFDNWNPWQLGGANSTMYNQVYSRLIWLRSDGEPQGDLAEAWELASDGLSVRIKLVENAHWHDGAEVTTEDFVRQMEYIKNEAYLEDLAIQKQAGLMSPVADLKVVDKFTMDLVFENPIPYYMEIFDYWWTMRIDDPDDLAFMTKLPVGTGPFQPTDWVPNEYSRYVRHEGYHLEGLPYLDEWRFNRLSQAETLAPNLLSGAVDGVFGIPLTDVDVIQARDDLRVDMDFDGITNIVINTNLPPFDKKEVRQALSYSLNREAVSEVGTFGLAMPTTTMWYDPSSLGYREDLVMAHPFDLDKAANLLEEAGVTDLEMTVPVISAWAWAEPGMLVWQADLAKIGVTLNVEQMETAALVEIGLDGNLKGYALCPWGNGRTRRDPAIFMSTQGNYRGGETNRYMWKNDEIEELVPQGEKELDPEKRRAIYQHINEILVDEVPMLNVMVTPAVWGWSTQVKGLRRGLLNFLNLQSAWLDK